MYVGTSPAFQSDLFLLVPMRFSMANLLIVDDEQSYRQLLTLVFDGDGHNIRTAMNGRDAVEKLNEEPADVIITDVRMPDMDGIELLRNARELLLYVGVVLMTAF